MSSTSTKLWPSMPCPRIYSSGLYCVLYHKTASQAERGGTRGHLSLTLIAFLPPPPPRGWDEGRKMTPVAASSAGRLLMGRVSQDDRPVGEGRREYAAHDLHCGMLWHWLTFCATPRLISSSGIFANRSRCVNKGRHAFDKRGSLACPQPFRPGVVAAHLHRRFANGSHGLGCTNESPQINEWP